MRKTFSEIYKQVFAEDKYLMTAKFFKNALFIWVLIDCLLTLPYLQDIYSPQSYIYFTPFGGRPIDWICGLLNHSQYSQLYIWFVAGQLVAITCGLFNIWPRLSCLLLWYCTVNLYTRSYSTLNGGNNLIVLLLLFLVFINTSGKRSEDIYGRGFAEFSQALTVVGIWMCRFQVCVVYFTAALFKVNGKLWANGMALYYVGQSDFATPWFASFSANHPMLMSIATYATVLFQLGFPFLVWWKGSRPLMLLAGMALHVGIIFSMGLFTFSLAMCCSYLVFLRRHWLLAFYKQITAIREKLPPVPYLLQQKIKSG